MRQDKWIIIIGLLTLASCATFNWQSKGYRSNAPAPARAKAPAVDKCEVALAAVYDAIRDSADERISELTEDDYCSQYGDETVCREATRLECFD